MKNNIFRSEVVVSLVLIGLTLLFLNPFQKLWMPTMFMSMVILAFIVAFVLLTGIIWKETMGDEREQAHRQVAGRVSFLVGTSLLVLGILVQTFQHRLDPWLLITLCGMVIVKLLARLYQDHTN